MQIRARMPSQLAIAVTVCAVAVAQRQPPSRLSFDVASVKKVDRGPLNLTLSPIRTGGNIHWIAGRPLLILYAYHLQSWRIPGLQADDSWYQIDAKTDPSTTEDQIRQMLQTLLVDRFKLASHRESREVNGYVLTVARGGPKIKPVADGEKAPPMPEYMSDRTPDWWEGRVMITVEGKGTLALTARRVTMHDVAEAMQDTLHTFVADQTGLAGRYYLGFEFARPNDDSELGPLAGVLRMETGLQLEKRKLATEFFVVDHIEKYPVEN